MGKIICLMEKSSTGKDTIYKHLQDYIGADSEDFSEERIAEAGVTTLFVNNDLE